MTINRRQLIAGSGAVIAGGSTTAALPEQAEAGEAVVPKLTRADDLQLWRELEALAGSIERMREKFLLAESQSHPLLRSAFLFDMRCSMTAMTIGASFVQTAALEQRDIDMTEVARYKASLPPPG